MSANRRWHRAVAGPGVLALLAACSYNPAPVPVLGATAEVAALAGEWDGQYWSAETGRSTA